MSQARPSPSQGAWCARHPAQPAQGICARCGNFSCGECTQNGAFDLCPACRAISGSEIPGFIWSRDRFHLDGLLSFCWERFQKDWVMISLGVLVFVIVSFAFSFVSSFLQAFGNEVNRHLGAGLSLIGGIIYSIFTAVLTGGLVVMLFDVLRGRPVDIGRLFSQFRRVGAYVPGTLLFALAVFVPVVLIAGGAGFAGFVLDDPTLGIALAAGASLVLLFPLAWLLLPFMFLEMEVALGGDAGGMQAVRNAFALAEGLRLRLFGYWALAALIQMGGALLCCIGLLPAFGLAQMLKTALWAAVRSGSGLPVSRPPA